VSHSPGAGSKSRDPGVDIRLGKLQHDLPESELARIKAVTVTAANPGSEVCIRHCAPQPGDGVSAAALQHACDHKITMGRPAEILNRVIPKQRSQEFWP